MAASTVTVDTNEWVYIDSFSIGHIVTNAQTFSMTVTDGGTAAVEYDIPTNQNMTTEDGLNIIFRPNVNHNNEHHTIHFLTDAGEGSEFYGLSGEWNIECPVSGVIQIWKPALMNPSDADFGSAGTITFTMEDQFGNEMVVPATGSGLTVGQAS